MTQAELSNDTIVALATPPGESGVGVIRLSGAQAPEMMDLIWQGSIPLKNFRSHQLYLGQLCDPGTENIIDQALVVWMRAPRSFTGEEVLEIHAHGGPLILNQLLEVLIQAGGRLAEPGEFTKRAYLNQKIDLLQAEAIGAMIQAKSEAALRNAHSQLQGRLSDEIHLLRLQVIDLVARVEAAIDFPEEDIEILAPKKLSQEIHAIQGVLQRWLECFHTGRLIREGVRLALIGRPNVGKSSLLNRLLDQEKAIVHHSPGTTRDMVEGWVDIYGVGFQVFDTAGIHQGSGAVEEEGIRRSIQMAKQADLTLWVLDGSKELTKDDQTLLKSLSGPTLVVANKIDLGAVLTDIPKDWRQEMEQIKPGWTQVSAKTGEGISELKDTVFKAVGLTTLSDFSHAYLNNARHRQALREASQSLLAADQALNQSLPAECVAADLRRSTQALAALLGEVPSEEILDRIFSQFCIGK